MSNVMLDKLSDSFVGLSDAQKLARISSSNLSNEMKQQVAGMVVAKSSTTALSASQATATATTTGFGTALKGLWATMLANPLILVGAAITAGLTAWNMYKHSVDEMRKSTSEAASVFSDTSSSIEEYSDKYKVLHDELTNANTTEERQHEIKSDLLSLQKELNDKYGEEYGKLNLVTDAYKDQTEAILAMNKAAAQKFLNENREGIEDAKTQMTSKKTYMAAMDISMYSESGSSILDLAKQMGLDVDANESTGTFTVRIKANPTEAYDSITDFMNQVTALQEDFGNDDYDIGSVLGISSTSLNHAKDKIDEFGVKYNSALEAEITINDKLSRSFEEVKGAVQKYNDALASGDETKILSARDNLNKVKNSIDLTSTDWKDYASVVTDVFDQADTDLYDFEGSLKSNKDGLMNFAKTLRGISKEDILAISDAGDNENFEKLREAADEYELSAEDVIAVLERLKIVQGDVGKFGEAAFTPLSKQEVISNINSLSEGFESIDKIMKSVSDKNNPFDYALLDDGKFTKIFSTLNDGGEAYTNFIEKVSSSPKDLNATQSAFDELVTTWIDGSGVLNGLTEDNAILATTMLQNMGIANAEEVVMSRLSAAQEHLAAQKAYTAEVSNDLANATASAIPGIIEEATQSDIAKVALAGLVLEKEFFNGNALDTSGDIENILSLVGVIGTASKALQALNAVKSGKVGAGGKANYDFIVSAAEKEYEDAIKAASEYKGKGSSTNVSYTGGPKTNKPSGSKKDKKETKKPIDWIARGTKVLQDEYAKLEELANKDTIAYLGLTQEEFDKAKSIFDNGLGNTAKGLSQLQSYADKAGLSLGELYTMIQSGAPSASKENALQSMLEMQTETLLPQYQREVEAYSKAYADALKDIPSEYKAKIENGGVDIESLPSDLAEKVQTAIDANEKLKKSEGQLEEGREKQIQTIQDLHENRIAATDIENEKLEQSNKIIKSQIELMEARGEIVDADFYKRQIRNNKGLISGNQKNIAEWESEMADLRKANVSTSSKEYKELQAKVRAAKNEIQGMKLEQEEYNNKLLQMPIENASILVSMYQDIGTAIRGWGDEVVASGGKLDADYYQSLIFNGASVIGQLQKQSSLIKDVMDNYEVGSNNWNELYKQLQKLRDVKCNSEHA
ncbi:hypothetical protein K413DRAFT_4759 [Clostridium sp. ASBs410]|nr:hypothetical protein K413DRAFT_4759 [Clostridium sp. ASBs410]